MLASSKRLIQIEQNNLIKKNDIIPYDFSDRLFLKIIIYLFSLINFIIILLFFFNDNLFFFDLFSSPQTKFNYSFYQIISVLFFYF